MASLVANTSTSKPLCRRQRNKRDRSIKGRSRRGQPRRDPKGFEKGEEGSPLLSLFRFSRRGPNLLPKLKQSGPSGPFERRRKLVMFARTERLLLRPGWAEDAPALARAIADEQVVRNLATAPWPYALEDAEAFLAAPRDPAMPSFLITERTDGDAADRRLLRAGPAAVGRGRAGLLDRPRALGQGLRHRGRPGADRDRPDAQAAAARGLALPRQSGIGPGAGEARLRAYRPQRRALQLRARRRSDGPALSAVADGAWRGGGAGGLIRAPAQAGAPVARSAACAAAAIPAFAGEPVTPRA